jgi:hypothetical protein
MVLSYMKCSYLLDIGTVRNGSCHKQLTRNETKNAENESFTYYSIDQMNLQFTGSKRDDKES